MNKPKYRCYSKGLAEETPGEIVRSQKWIAARRARLNIYDDRVICGDWDIPFSTTSDIMIYKGWSFPFPVKVLELVVGNKAYQFGINGWNRPEKHLPKHFRIAPINIKYSPFSVVYRIVLLALICYWLWEVVIK